MNFSLCDTSILSFWFKEYVVYCPKKNKIYLLQIMKDDLEFGEYIITYNITYYLRAEKSLSKMPKNLGYLQVIDEL